MSYRLEGKDIVISGFEQGIADTPYNGIADMRNMEIIGVGGEASVNFKNTPVTAPPVFDETAFTAQATGDTITISDTTGLYEGCAIVLDTNTATGLSTGTVYYVFDLTATTFTVKNNPAGFGSNINITADGSGTLTTYQYGRQRGVGTDAPVSYFADTTGQYAGVNGVYILDASNYAWVVFPTAVGDLSAYTLYFLGNIGGAATQNTAGGIAVWNDYVVIFGDSTKGIDIADVDDLLLSGGPASSWDYNWENYSAGTVTKTIVSQEDGNLYFTTSTGLGSLIEQPGQTFDPATGATYELTSTALRVPATDKAISLTELGINLYIGGINAYIYPWDKLSPGFGTPIIVPESYQAELVGTDQNLFAFSGNKGRIYISNGSSVSLYKKLPEYVTGIANPYIQFYDASYSRGELVFSFLARSNDNTELTSTAGVWAINAESKAFRLLSKLTSSGYGGRVPMVVEMPRPSIAGAGNQVPGVGLLVGWNDGTTTYGIDRPSSDVYESDEAYIETDMIPVGTYLDPFSPAQIEWKTSYPLGAGGEQESIKISYRTDLSQDFTEVGNTSADDGTVIGSETGTTTGQSAVSDWYKANFQKAQWVQLKIESSSNSTSPTYNRLTEVRIRKYPS